MLKEAERSSQVLKILNDELILVNVISYVVLPLLSEGAKPLDIGVGKVAPESQLCICLNADAVLVKLGPAPNLFSLETVVAQLGIIQVQRQLQNHLLA